MKNRDLIKVCIQNLMRHKARTMLTVLGVIVGCCSVIIMISIGIGMKEMQEKTLSEMGDLTIIQVYPAGKGAKAAKLTDKTVKTLKDMREVETATPKLSADNLTVTLYAGRDKRYRSTYTTLVGMDPEAAKTMGYQLLEGVWDNKKPFKVVAGQNFAYNFEDTKRPEGKNMVDAFSMEFDEKGMPILPPAYFEPMKTPLTIEIETGKEGKNVVQKLEVSGKMKEDYGKGEETSMGLVMRLEDFQSLIEQQAKLAGKKLDKKKGYSNVLVKVKSIQDVVKVENTIKKMGYRTSSMESIRKPMEKEARQKQMMLGGLGAISLFVAALGITNTMIMSISERTREIGVMKSLGCFVQDVRKIFLLEAGCICLLGGIIGTLISYLVSIIMNVVSSQTPAASVMDALAILTTKGSRLSVIPWWLASFGILFSIMIGVGAGYYPADKAVGISALEAIKHD